MTHRTRPVRWCCRTGIGGASSAANRQPSGARSGFAARSSPSSACSTMRSRAWCRCSRRKSGFRCAFRRSRAGGHQRERPVSDGFVAARSPRAAMAVRQSAPRRRDIGRAGARQCRRRRRTAAHRASANEQGPSRHGAADGRSPAVERALVNAAADRALVRPIRPGKQFADDRHAAISQGHPSRRTAGLRERRCRASRNSRARRWRC